MTSGSIARRYARAILELASEGDGLDRTASDLDGFVALLDGHDELERALLNPGHPITERKAVLAAVLEKTDLTSTNRNFIRLLLDKGRLGALRSICREYQALADEAQGRVRARVTSARKIDKRTAGRLQKNLEAITGKTVILSQEVDPALIGGTVTQVGHLVFDGSIRAALARVRQRLVSDYTL